MLIESVTDLLPGDIGFGPIDGGPGIIVWFGHLMLGERVRIHRRKVDHVFGITEVTETTAFAVEAMPGGAREVDISDRWTDRYIYMRLPVASKPYVDLSVTRNQIWTVGDQIAYELRKMKGTPYSFLDYGSLALHHWKIRPDWVRDYITSTGHMICSQLEDQALTRAGIKVFDDGRLSQDVTPGALYYQLSRYLGATIIWPEGVKKGSK